MLACLSAPRASATPHPPVSLAGHYSIGASSSEAEGVEVAGHVYGTAESRLCFPGEPPRVDERARAEVGQDEVPHPRLAGGDARLGRGGVAEAVRPLCVVLRPVGLVDEEVRSL